MRAESVGQVRTYFGPGHLASAPLALSACSSFDAWNPGSDAPSRLVFLPLPKLPSRWPSRQPPSGYLHLRTTPSTRDLFGWRTSTPRILSPSLPAASLRPRATSAAPFFPSALSPLRPPRPPRVPESRLSLLTPRGPRLPSPTRPSFDRRNPLCRRAAHLWPAKTEPARDDSNRQQPPTIQVRHPPTRQAINLPNTGRIPIRFIFPQERRTHSSHTPSKRVEVSKCRLG